MASETFTAPLFPLSAHILPGGAMTLRIFESRYVRMVKEACAQQTGFVICMLNTMGNKEKNQHIYPIGTYVTVEDFNLLEDGLLGITIRAHYCVHVDSIVTEKDQLRVGHCKRLEIWSSDPITTETTIIDTKLKEVFDKYPEVNALYPNADFTNPVWVIYRWLELLPVNAEQKQSFLQQKNCLPALEFLSQLVE
ncbi:LON peptidase substrate-binding domain-containing protein [Aliiglaciecola lipolytica]|uniref:Lon N-terminal domain-containing protein n=1 Tax=Aliiglaciecola lipolytica E3 TaxID=1127673 RepID=K6YCH3_9ALTE|nr:LON peptidase substrate-binding domain-containing protein [Aliiglaciecola lipolytica]GAC15887.1 hypothetical protein GLIP_3273 [Aliiglaciecola lipolytica E3]